LWLTILTLQSKLSLQSTYHKQVTGKDAVFFNTRR